LTAYRPRAMMYVYATKGDKMQDRIYQNRRGETVMSYRHLKSLDPTKVGIHAEQTPYPRKRSKRKRRRAAKSKQ